MEAHAESSSDRSTVIRNGVSNELIAILAVGVMLAGLVFTTASWSRDDMQVLRDDLLVLRDDLLVLRDDMLVLRDEVRSVRSGLSDLRERVARIETLLEERFDTRPGA